MHLHLLPPLSDWTTIWIPGMALVLMMRSIVSRVNLRVDIAIENTHWAHSFLYNNSIVLERVQMTAQKSDVRITMSLSEVVEMLYTYSNYEAMHQAQTHRHRPSLQLQRRAHPSWCLPPGRFALGQETYLGRHSFGLPWHNRCDHTCLDKRTQR
jgi:hypothetical protein